MNLLLERGADVSADAFVAGKTAIHSAAHQGHTEVVKILLDHWVHVESKDVDGRTPMHWAAHFGKEAVVQVLLDAGADEAATTNAGETPLDLATASSHAAVVELLQRVAARRASGVAFAMGLHERLGGGSCVSGLEAALVQMVLERAWADSL